MQPSHISVEANLRNHIFLISKLFQPERRLIFSQDYYSSSRNHTLQFRLLTSSGYNRELISTKFSKVAHREATKLHQSHGLRRYLQKYQVD